MKYFLRKSQLKKGVYLQVFTLGPVRLLYKIPHAGASSFRTRGTLETIYHMGNS